MLLAYDKSRRFKKVTNSLYLMKRQVNFLPPTEIDAMGPRYNRHPGPFAINEADLNRIFPGIKHINSEPYLEGEYAHLKGDLDPAGLKILTRIIEYLKPEHMVELGTFRGKTTYNMAKASPGSRIITIDLPVEMRTGKEESEPDCKFSCRSIHVAWNITIINPFHKKPVICLSIPPVELQYKQRSIRNQPVSV